MSRLAALAPPSGAVAPARSSRADALARAVILIKSLVKKAFLCAMRCIMEMVEEEILDDVIDFTDHTSKAKATG